jgi:hypothetical protein
MDSNQRQSASGMGRVKVTLSPYRKDYGIAIHGASLSSTRMVVFELAESIPGQSGQTPLSTEGVLVYTVDATVKNQPINIMPKTGGFTEKYGNKYLAPFSVGDRLAFWDYGILVQMTVLSKFVDSYVIEVSLNLGAGQVEGLAIQAKP